MATVKITQLTENTSVAQDDVLVVSDISENSSRKITVANLCKLSNDLSPQLAATLDANGQNIDMGVNTITDPKVGQWETAYSWGDHSLAGYALATAIANASNWDTAYSWGDHSTFNYATTTGDTFTGNLSMGSNSITNLANPSADSDAANKLYVDQVAQGIAAKPAVHAATTANLSGTYDNGTLGVGATLTLAAAATLDIDGVTSWSQYDGILVKDQTNAFENGRYYVSTVGDAGTAWVLTRCSLCDEAAEIPSGYVFVQEGSTYADTGWIATVANVGTFTVGTDDIDWTQFSGVGTYTAGTDLTLTGTVFSVNSSISANAATATALETARTIAGVSFNGTANIDIPVDNLSDVDTSGVTNGQVLIYNSTSTNWEAGDLPAGYSDSDVNTYLQSADQQIDSLGVGTAASGTSGEIRATNNITAYYSDMRLKTKTGDIENAVELVNQLSGFYYEANETAQALGYEVKREVGVSAQEVEAVMPEVVAPAPIDSKYLTVRYERLVPLLIEAIKELSKEVKELKGE